MFESEVNKLTESVEQIPMEALNQFKRTSENVTKKSILPWTEHCIECVWPTCYTTCSLYDPRKDGKCQRFLQGMVRLPFADSISGYLLKITFKKWGKLLAQGTTQLYSSKEIRTLEKSDLRIGEILQKVPGPKFLKKHIYRKRYGVKNRQVDISGKLNNVSDIHFLAEIFNPTKPEIQATLTIRSEGKMSHMPYQKLFRLKNGYNRIEISISEIKKSVSLNDPFKIEITPNNPKGNNITLIFGITDFVQQTKSTGKRIKCVIWDLDNTLWNGTLIEDGQNNIKFKDDVIQIIHELDNRGVLQSISSKNNAFEAEEMLKFAGVDGLMLIPQINWNPKGQNIKNIIEQLNIGSDSVLFIDDQKFERDEVKSMIPEIQTLDATLVDELLNKPELNYEVTADGKNRRKLYQNEISRKKVKADFDGDYFDFLKKCQLNLILKPLSTENIDRVKELVQRTNQMNFSGNSYSQSELEDISSDNNFDTFVMECKDVYGDYGIIGFGIFDVGEKTLIDLMFSCRIQSKRVEHAFITHILNKYHKHSDIVHAFYHKTAKNSPSGKVFDDFSFKIDEITDEIFILSHHQDQPIPDDKIITVNS